jgi:arylformamidase
MEDDAAWIDISVPLVTGMVTYPGDPPVHISSNCLKNKGEPLVSHISLCAHAGTHIDAPLHFISGGKSVDLMPAKAMIGPALVIGIADPHVISVQDLERENIAPGERILFKTRNSSLWRTDLFVEDSVYLSTESALFLAQKGVLTVGIDYLSVGGFDRNQSEVHGALLEAGVWIIEGLDLSGVEPGWYDLVCMPILMTGREAAPARAMVRPRRRTVPR